MTNYLTPDTIADRMVTEATAARTAHQAGDPATAVLAARRAATLAWQLTIELEPHVERCSRCKRDLPAHRVENRDQHERPLCDDCKYHGGPPSEPA